MIFEEENILLTGATGFVGKRFLEYNSEKFNIYPVSFEKWDETNIEIFKNAKIIVHSAGIAHRMEKTDPDLYFEVNFRKTKIFADIAKRYGIKHFIFISTIKAFGEFQNGILTEASPCKADNDPYGQSKLLAENYLKSIEDENFIVSIIRPPLIYGPGVKGNLIKFLELADTLLPLPFKNVANKRTMIFLDNLVELLNTVIRKRISGLFLASDDNPISTEYLISEIRSNLDKPLNIFSLPSFLVSFFTLVKPELILRLFDSLEMDPKYSYERLGYKPPYSTEFGIKQMVDWYKNKDYQNEKGTK